MNQWIKIKEKMPEFRTWVLVVTEFGYMSSAALEAEKEWVEQRWIDQRGYVIRGVTHWQPLPELPES